MGRIFWSSQIKVRSVCATNFHHLLATHKKEKVKCQQHRTPKLTSSQIRVNWDPVQLLLLLWLYNSNIQWSKLHTISALLSSEQIVLRPIYILKLRPPLFCKYTQTETNGNFNFSSPRTIQIYACTSCSCLMLLARTDQTSRQNGKKKKFK